MTVGTSGQQPDEPQVQAALRRVSATVWRAFLAAELGGRDGSQAPPESGPTQAEAGAQPQAPAPSSHPSTAAAPVSSGEARRA